MAKPQGNPTTGGGGIPGPPGPSIFSHTSTSGPIYISDPNDFIIGVDATLNPVSINLVSATLMAPGAQIYIKDEKGNSMINNITITTAGLETIDGVSTIIISNNYSVLRLYSNGINWLSF